MNFSKVLTSARRRRRGRRCIDVVRGGGRLLLRLVDSVLSLSGVRTKALRFRCSGMRLGDIVGRLRDMLRLGLGSSTIHLRFMPSLSVYPIRVRGGELSRLLVGLVAGTVGFASRKDIHFNCRLRKGRLCFCISSAKYNVPGSGRRDIFKHFIGLGGFTRNAKLKLSVYRALMGRVKNYVNIRSRRNGKTAF